MNETTQPASMPPLGKAYHTSQLDGWAAKWLEIPPGRSGVAIFRNGQERVFPAGRQRILTPIERLRGLGAGLRAGYLPAQPFAAWLKAGSLLSGDQELLDASLLCMLEVGSSAQFFRQVIWPAGVLEAGIVDLSDETLSQILNNYTLRYAAADLVNGLPTARLLPEIQLLLEPLLAGRGLRLQTVQLLIFQRSADRALVAQKTLELQQKMQEIQLEGQMAAVENQAALEEFAQQVNVELGQAGGLRFTPGSFPGAAETVSNLSPLKTRVWLEALKKWAKDEMDKMHNPWRITAMWKKGEAAAAAPASLALPSGWWARRLVWVAVLISIGFVLSRVVTNLAANSGWTNPWELVSLIWAFVIGGVFESMKVLYERREKLYEAMINPPARLSLSDLAKKDREKLDQLVRTQISGDLLRCRDTLNDLRSRVYRDGKEPLALRIKELEGKIERQAEQVRRTDPAFAEWLNPSRIKNAVWEQVLAGDEALLARAAALVDDAQAVRLAYQQGAFQPPVLQRLEGAVDSVMHAYQNRSRLVQVDPALQEHFRDQQPQTAA